MDLGYLLIVVAFVFGGYAVAQIVIALILSWLSNRPDAPEEEE